VGRGKIISVSEVGMRIIRGFGWWLWVLPVVLTLGSSSTTQAKPEFSKKESKSCTYCHVKLGDKELNDAGKYYKEHNFSLAGYQAPAAPK
jgi:hypothetical protein